MNIMEAYEKIKSKLKEKGFKVTPQRVTVLEALSNLNHPTADQLIDYIRKNHPGIATGTVYHILESFVEKGIIMKVKTDKDIMRYDVITKSHHHIYCSDSDRIEDYNNEELNEILDKYFEEKGIPGFKIEDIKLQIIGKFINNKQ
jgi:Fur family transcriptional regulator, peroxide stress response regulator